MEPRRRRPPQETVVELGETTVSEEAGAKAEWRNTRQARSVAASLVRPEKKNDYSRTGLQKIQRQKISGGDSFGQVSFY